MWKSDAARVRFTPADGMELLARGHVQVYAQQGQVPALRVEPPAARAGGAGTGVPADAGEARGRGAVRAERKRPLPAYPTRIALVTSSQTAALQDMLKVLRRFPWVAAVRLPRARAGRRLRQADRRGDRAPQPARRALGGARRRHPVPRRRVAGRPVGLQRGGRRPGGGGLPDPGGDRHRPRGGHEHRRPRRRLPRPHADRGGAGRHGPLAGRARRRRRQRPAAQPGRPRHGPARPPAARSAASGTRSSAGRCTA